jgi:SAM-dependent methyltransferase
VDLVKIQDGQLVRLEDGLRHAIELAWSENGELGAGRPVLDCRIDAQDEMFTFGNGGQPAGLVESVIKYFGVGLDELRTVEDVLRRAGRDLGSVDAILDFACGFGRFTRFLLQQVPASRLWVCDVQREAVEFQSRAFGVHGFVSDDAPGRVRFPRRYALITVYSLFSHLPERLFAEWLWRLTEQLEDGGLLLITTHGPWCFQEATGQPMHAEFVFDPVSESTRLDRQRYGTSYCTLAHMQRVIAGRDVTLLGHLPRGLNAHQDLYVLGRQVPASVQPLVRAGSAKIYIDSGVLEGDDLVVEGLGLESAGARAGRCGPGVRGRVASRSRRAGP